MSRQLVAMSPAQPKISTVRLLDVPIVNGNPRVTSPKALPLWGAQLHALVGEGESAKSWLAAHAALDVANHNRPVLIFDGERSAATWRQRLEQLGAIEQQLELVRYAEITADSSNIDQVLTTCQTFNPAMIVWDSALSLLSRSCQSENDNSEVSRVYDRLRDIVRRSHTAGLIVDHTSRAGTTLVSRGASAKFNALDVSYGMSLTAGTPNRRTDWEATVSIEKDRHGQLGERHDMCALFHPLGSGRLAIDLSTTTRATNRLSGNSRVDHITRQLAALDPPPTSANDAFRRLRGNRPAVLAAYRAWQADDS